MSETRFELETNHEDWLGDIEICGGKLAQFVEIPKDTDRITLVISRHKKPDSWCEVKLRRTADEWLWEDLDGGRWDIFVYEVDVVLDRIFGRDEGLAATVWFYVEY